MSPTTEGCADLAAEVQALEAAERSAREELAGMVGAAAWDALAHLAEVRHDLADTRTSLEECLAGHAAPWRIHFAVVHEAPPPLPTGRVAQLYEPGLTSPTTQSRLAHGLFSFDGAVPTRFVVLVSSEGLPDITGPDFRTGLIDATAVDGTHPLRAEVVIGPEIEITSGDVARWAGAIQLPLQTDVSSTTSGQSAHITLRMLAATLGTGTLELSGNGTVDWTAGLGFDLPSSPFTVTLSVAVHLPAAATAVEPFQLSVVAGPDVQVSGLPGALVAFGLPLVRASLEAMFVEQVQNALEQGVRALVAGAFALENLPQDVTLCIRSLRAGDRTLTFQPAIGAMGTQLSTFAAPVIPAP
jgi:hypothetical protein